MPDYYGNPYTGLNAGEPYVFLNFLDLAGAGFDEIIFSEPTSTAGYESDNHTVGWFNTKENPGGLIDPELCESGDSSCIVVPPSAVPEPATWAMLILGFGVVGTGMRRRRLTPRLA
ncbi:PEPxxWA-CTERM sorting domain-containing protein [Sphingomonas sp. XMGL2]|uniref:PEPxxWA-CTERM sorting domain-containing protein n=2 Tax=Sphingomonas quercus TaxID=2842451 RepID=A0ABS6BES3_9SPHN|nr:PEPxxWA-CTERM sorting domain-containing protein [Sphingomonas quercus]